MTQPAQVVREYHERTKHSFESVRRSGRALDWPNFPHPFKEYVGLEGEPLPDGLARLLRLGGGVVRSRGDYHFRTYSSAGALYPNELYVSGPEGLFHFHPGELALRRLRPEAVLGEALAITGIHWRTGWKYGERGYRHLYWDAGTLLANLLAAGERGRVRVGFVDDEVNRALGVDGVREAALAILALSDLPARIEAAAIDHEARPLSRREERSRSRKRRMRRRSSPSPAGAAPRTATSRCPGSSRSRSRGSCGGGGRSASSRPSRSLPTSWRRCSTGRRLPCARTRRRWARSA